MYFLDSNTCIYYLNGKSESIRKRILATPPADIKIPALVKAELLLGAYKRNLSERRRERLEEFLSPFEVMAFDDSVSYVYATIRKKTEENGTIVGPNDLMIAAIVKFHEGILVTRNTTEFSRIDGLLLESWWDIEENAV